MDGSENRDCGLFTVLFEQYREPFTRFANSFVRDRAVSENLFVDALVDYWQRRGSLPEDTNVPAYLLTSVRNKALNHLRHQRIRERSSDELMRRARSELDFRISSKISPRSRSFRPRFMKSSGRRLPRCRPKRAASSR